MTNKETLSASKKTAFKKYWLTDTELRDISDDLSGETKLVFQIIVATGQSFESIANSQWDGLNARLSTIKINDINYTIPVATSKALANLRENAQSGEGLIFSITYKYAWERTSKSYFKLGIDQRAGVLKLAKYSFVRRHYDLFRNKARLARDMGITTTRYLPKALFKLTNAKACLVQF